ncbi:MAG: hypothetical protein ACR2FG_08355 [Marmoricola sp.]
MSPGDRTMPGDGTGPDRFALALQSAYHDTRLHSPQAVPEVEDRLSTKLDARGITLTADVLRALAFAIVNDRGL